ncbi:SDR family NAD(P)-dependent oxidoreductase [Kutzneria buriramensis]|uniref:SDR family NAD(P)-dependent oxidoreductase n=1 Tax=Kutzneria buriramensis TaxID=1045776 RepID=UPI001B87CA5A|nr:SDR family NAD(P)-dependent oxidoreductase [Kutzneria buriramensis]
MKTAPVTGASSGIGEAVATKLHTLGYTVYGAARRAERLSDVAGSRALSMDVTDDASMRTGVEKIVADTGRLDVLVNNAGYGSYGAVEDVPMDEARHQREVNVFGAARRDAAGGLQRGPLRGLGGGHNRWERVRPAVSCETPGCRAPVVT